MKACSSFLEANSKILDQKQHYIIHNEERWHQAINSVFTVRLPINFSITRYHCNPQF